MNKKNAQISKHQPGLKAFQQSPYKVFQSFSRELEADSDLQSYSCNWLSADETRPCIVEVKTHLYSFV